ncbi:Phosphoenolpyruvate/pyruvate domain-containing protein [Cylindrobasidium torrendii FP15055 ss-10]|uniref:Phosphoenolpyruvate/pyruvate domain-containing protein n=1 Tax=Cylindrobasidium torrendii FP15055 ss-10 TaxID=1314674 RepID=A0A0D7AWX8_9AGAR|nr:Phosphoenolpyruvate/pyruvate domain-containing protein [Cylindrobasidium torrendii FP15055 ss-10]
MDRYNASHPRQSPNLRQALRDAASNDTALFGTIIGLPSLDVAKVIAATDCDFAAIDAEHTPYSATSLSEMVQTVRAYSRGRMIPIVRVPTHTHEWIAWAVDAGAGGVIMPHTESAEEVREMINAAKFPPHGHRSFPPFALLPIDGQNGPTNGKTWFETSNEHIAIIPQIESAKGVENAEAMMQIPEVDAIMIGQMDLTMDVGGSAEKAAELISHVEALALKYNKPLLAFIMNKADMPAKLKAGYRLAVISADVYALTGSTNAAIAEFREAATGKGLETTHTVVKDEPSASRKSLVPTTSERKAVSPELVIGRLSMGILLVVAFSFLRGQTSSWVR